MSADPFHDPRFDTLREGVQVLLVTAPHGETMRLVGAFMVELVGGPWDGFFAPTAWGTFTARGSIYEMRLDHDHADYAGEAAEEPRAQEDARG